MKRKSLILWVAGAIALVIAGSLILRPAGGVENVDATRMAELAGEGVRILDVRTTGEFSAGHIEGAENVPIDQFAAAAATWDRGEPVAVYCATGSRSAEAVRILEQNDFSTVYHFDAGLVAWQGDLSTDTATAPRTGSTARPTGTPVMYEFYTDW